MKFSAQDLNRMTGIVTKRDNFELPVTAVKI